MSCSFFHFYLLYEILHDPTRPEVEHQFFDQVLWHIVNSTLQHLKHKLNDSLKI